MVSHIRQPRFERGPSGLTFVYSELKVLSLIPPEMAFLKRGIFLQDSVKVLTAFCKCQILCCQKQILPNGPMLRILVCVLDSLNQICDLHTSDFYMPMFPQNSSIFMVRFGPN